MHPLEVPVVDLTHEHAASAVEAELYAGKPWDLSAFYSDRGPAKDWDHAAAERTKALVSHSRQRVHVIKERQTEGSFGKSLRATGNFGKSLRATAPKAKCPEKNTAKIDKPSENENIVKIDNPSENENIVKIDKQKPKWAAIVPKKLNTKDTQDVDKVAISFSPTTRLPADQLQSFR